MQTASKRVINGWAMFDWANSVYNLVITTTFFPIYFTTVAKNGTGPGSDKITFLGFKFVNSSLYEYSLAAAYLIIALSYPILTSVADTRGNKKNFMRFFSFIGAFGCTMLFFFTGMDTLWLGILAFMMAAMGYVGSLVFYNAFLPEIAAPEDRDRISAKGFSYGYIGSVIMQLIGFGLVLAMPDSTTPIRITFLLVGLWWFGFAQITFARLPKINRQDLVKVNVFKQGFAETKRIYKEVNLMPVLKRYLRGFFFYSMGVQTVMLAATIVGSKLLGLPETKLIVTVVLIQLVAIPGALLISRLSAKFGNLKVLMTLIVFWVVICFAGYKTAERAEPLKPFHHQVDELKHNKSKLKEQKAPDAEIRKIDAEIETVIKSFEPQQAPVEYAFYALAIAVGLVMGGIQSLSRSTYSKLMPQTKNTASYFSYYDLTEKIAIVIGMFTFGFIAEYTEKHGGMKNSLLALIVFFLIGLFWLYLALIKQKKMKVSAIG
ncbi:MAG: MFS transporter [Bacteroidota bacterium]